MSNDADSQSVEGEGPMSEEPSKTPDEMRAYINGAPEPMKGKPIWKQFKGDEGYEKSALALARAMLVEVEKDPTLLDVPLKEEDPTGFARADGNPRLHGAIFDQEGLNDWLGGVSGFQWGWAHNAVRYAVGAEPVGNPAIVTLGA